MLFTIVYLHAGLIPAIFVFFWWTIPGALGMYGLSLGVQRIQNLLPSSVYAFLSGLNAATVGIIALSAVQLARRAMTDKMTKILLVFGACAGLCYSALWYFPLLVISGGVVAIAWDMKGQNLVRRFRQRRRSITDEIPPDAGNNLPLQPEDHESLSGPYRRHPGSSTSNQPLDKMDGPEIEHTAGHDLQIANARTSYALPIKSGLIVIALFFVIFTGFMVLRGVVKTSPLVLSLFTNMLLAGTIIFGGGPVVIPLLRTYVVDPGWVSSRDFLLGLAIIQAFPGPNFNFAVYLGSLTIANSDLHIISFVGGLIGFFGMYTPGLWLSVGFQSILGVLRKRREVTSFLRGVNAVAVGFIFTAVYRLWQIGYLTNQSKNGISLGEEPWWLVIAAVSFATVEWFDVPPAIAIIIGGLSGLGWWGVVRR